MTRHRIAAFVVGIALAAASCLPLGGLVQCQCPEGRSCGVSTSLWGRPAVPTSACGMSCCAHQSSTSPVLSTRQAAIPPCCAAGSTRNPARSADQPGSGSQIGRQPCGCRAGAVQPRTPFLARVSNSPVAATLRLVCELPDLGMPRVLASGWDSRGHPSPHLLRCSSLRAPPISIG